jgi:DNA-binding NarL/FixJ family response regulator
MRKHSMRIVLADSQANVRFALRTLLERQNRVQVVGEAPDLGALIKQVGTSCPDLVLLDCGLRGAAWADLPSILRQACPGLAVVILSGQPGMRQAALAAGADAFVCKVDPPERLLAAILPIIQAGIGGQSPV